MISVEKLSLFNIDIFRRLYDINKNSYSCDENFFEIYDKESFIIKYAIRKQVRLFKMKNKYFGYIWYGDLTEEGVINIYSLQIDDEYINVINSKMLEFIRSKYIKYDMIDNLKVNTIMDKFEFKPICQAMLMKLNIADFNFEKKNENYIVRKFKKNQDEKLRCDIQNSVFDDKNRIPLTAGDIYVEEDEDYYLDEYAIFICNTENVPVGYGQIIYNKGIYTIVNLGILEAYRGQRYGEKLIRYLINLCYENSIKDIHIKVEKKNLKAISLYRKIGFKEYDSLTTWSKFSQ